MCILRKKKFKKIVNRIAGKIKLKLIVVAQDTHLANNQNEKSKICGDNGIFKGVPLTEEEKNFQKLQEIFIKNIPYDGKYILANKTYNLPKQCKKPKIYKNDTKEQQ